ncbi:MAG: hypothetical protein EBX52_03260 [Proteobacteria bacterium]|nr:hypothetical protein [Pseudomonadota bacterium]
MQFRSGHSPSFGVVIGNLFPLTSKKVPQTDCGSQPSTEENLMITPRPLPRSPIPVTLLAAALLAGCNLPPDILTRMNVNFGRFAESTPASTPEPAPPPASAPQSCKDTDPESQCIGLRIVSYDNGNETVLPYADALALVVELNRVWTQCKIGFELSSYEHVDPVTRGLSINPNWRSEGSQIRAAFNDQKSFLVVAVGNFAASTIAVTEMPGYGPYGTLVESGYASNPLTVGHELGHYMGLYHVRNSSNLMNPYIGPHTEQLSPSQCSIARSKNAQFWVSLLK